MNKKEKTEITKEIQNLKELSEQALDTLQNDSDLIQEMDQNMIESNESFQNSVEELLVPEEIIEEKQESDPNSPKEKKNPFQKVKEKWSSLSKKTKIGIIVGSILIIILIGIGLFFLLRKEEKQENKPKVPDVIVELENYRYQNGTLIFLNRQKKELGSYTCKNQDQELCYIVDYNDEDNFDEPKMIYEDGSSIPLRSKIILDRYVFLHDETEEKSGLIILYDIQEQKEIDTFQSVKGYEMLENMVVLKNKTSQYGLYRLTNEGLENVLPSEYDYIGVIEHNKNQINKVVTKQNGKWNLTDLENKTLTKALSEEIRDYNDYSIKTINEAGEYHVFDYNNNQIAKEGYDYIDLLDNYMLLIKENKMYIRDYENHKMNAVGIDLEYDSYIPTSTYNKDSKKLITTDKSYEISYQGSFMKIEVSKPYTLETKTVNLNEGRVSKNLKNLEYFDGTLYIYTDEKKENLIGTYTCNNKNNIDDNTNNLTYCKMAKESFYQDNDIEINHTDSLGVLPIYNNRYAFIYDTSSRDNEPTIHLYDMLESTSLAKYKSVDASSYNKEENVNFVSTNNLEIMAENKNGKFGIIRIKEQSVEGVIDFTLNHIEKIGMKYIFQDDGGYYLASHEGKRETSSATNKIRNYNETAQYVTRMNDGKYYLYPYQMEEDKTDKEDSEKDKISYDLKGYDYIALYDEYYATVNNKTLNLYSYKKPDYNFIEEGILLEKENYYGEGTLAFKINFGKNNASIEIGTKDDKYKAPRNVSLVIKETDNPVVKPNDSKDENDEDDKKTPTSTNTTVKPTTSEESKKETDSNHGNE